MKRIKEFFERLIMNRKTSAAWRVFSSVLACIVVFVTTYSLILPAATLSSTAASESAGIYMGESHEWMEEAEDDDELRQYVSGYDQEVPEDDLVTLDDLGDELFEEGDEISYAEGDLWEDGLEDLEDIYGPYESVTEAEAAAQTELAAETEAAAEAAAQTEFAAETEAATEAAAQTELAAETEAATETAAQTELAAETEAATETAAQTELAAETEAAPETTAQTELAAETEVTAEAAAQTELTAETEQEAQTELTAEPQTEAVTEEALFEDETETEIETEAETEETYAAGSLTYEGADYTVQLSYDAAAQIPADAYLTVRELAQGTAEYQQYLAAAGAALGADENTEANVKKARFFDISIVRKNAEDEETEIEPAGTVQVEISYDKAVRVADAEQVSALHFDDKTKEASVLELSDLDQNASGTSVSGMTFDTDGFSVFGVIYTVDFTYNGYEYSIQGEDQITISELFAQLGIEEDPANVVGVTFTDTSLVEVQRQGEEFLLVSLAPFTSNELLAVRLANGDRYEIQVTDAQEVRDISSLLTGVVITIDGQTVTDDTWKVRAGQQYNLSLRFRENSNQQFSNNYPLTYVLPEGFSSVGASNNGVFDVKVDNKVVSGNTYSISQRADGRYVLTINWNQDSPNFQDLKDSGMTSLKIDITGSFSENAKSLDFYDSVHKEVEIDNSSNVKVAKTGWYDAAAGKIHYTVTVTSQGNSENVKVTDTIKGTAVKMENDDTITMTKNGRQTTVSKNGSGKGFSYTIGSMSDGETVTFSYTATVDPDKIGKSGQATFDETGNTVNVSSNNDSNPKDNTSEYYCSWISFNSSINKHSTEVSDIKTRADGKKYKTVTWKISVNPERKVSMSGSQIKDIISDASKDIMSYSGSGISMVVTKEDGSTVTRTIPWSQLGVGSEADKTWTYNVPSGDGKYGYEITYTTDVLINDETQYVSVQNAVTGKPGTDYGNVPVNQGNGGTGEGGEDNPGTDTPTGPAVSKTYTQISEKEITWKISVVVPKEGYSDYFTVTDTFPQYGGDHKLKDTFKSLSISGLDGSESYDYDFVKETLATQNADGSWDNTRQYVSGVQINFYKDKNKTKGGLNAVSADRVITITLVTENNQEWMERTAGDAWNGMHVNNVTVDTASGSSSATAKATPQKKTVTKSGKQSGTAKVNGVDYPIYRYELLLTGVTEDTLELNDTFDTTALKHWGAGDPSINTARAADADTIAASGSISWNEDDTGIPNGSAAAVITDTDSGIRILASSLPKTPTGTFYSYYKIVYYLIPNGESGLERLRALALAENGEATLTNQVSYGDSTASAEVTYSYKPLTKEVSQNPDESGYYTYTIVVNDSKAMLNGGVPMTLTDTYENMSVDYTTIQVTTDPAENRGLVSWNYSGNVGTYTVPDQTRVELTYKVRPYNDAATFSMINTAEMKGYSVSSTKSVTIDTSASGQAYNGRLRLMKYVNGTLSSTLSGAKFELLDENRQPVKYGPGAKDGKAGKAVTFTTGEDGVVEVFLSSSEDDAFLEVEYQDDDGTIVPGKRYYLHEIEAPAGYQVSQIYYSFYLTTIVSRVDYGQYVYFNNDVMKVADDANAGILLKKTISGAADLTEAQKEAITFTVTGPNGYRREIKYSAFVGGQYKLPDAVDKANNITYLPTGTYKVVETASDLDAATPIVQKSYSLDGGSFVSYLPDGSGSFTDSGVDLKITDDDIATGKDHTVLVLNKYQEEQRTNPDADTTEITVRKVWKQNGEVISEPDDADAVQVELVRYKALGTETVPPTATLHFVDQSGRALRSDMTVPYGLVTATVSVTGDHGIDIKHYYSNQNARDGASYGSGTSHWTAYNYSEESFDYSFNVEYPYYWIELTPQASKPLSESYTSVNATYAGSTEATVTPGAFSFDQVVGDPVTLDGSNFWRYKFTELPRIDRKRESGKIYVYRYAIREVSIGDSAVATEYTYAGSGAATLTAGSQSVDVIDGTGTVVVTNDRTVPTGTLIINKKFLGPQLWEKKDKVAFKIYDPNGKLYRTISYSDFTKSNDNKDGTYTLTNLPVGTYRIVEDRDIGMGVDHYYSVDTTIEGSGIVSKDADNATANVQIEEDASSSVTYRNTYTETKDITIQKRWYRGNIQYALWDQDYGDAAGDVDKVYFNLYQTVQGTNTTRKLGTYIISRDSNTVSYADFSTEIGRDAYLAFLERERAKGNNNEDSYANDQIAYENESEHWMLTVSGLPVTKCDDNGNVLERYGYSVVECTADGTDLTLDQDYWTCGEYNGTVTALKNILCEVSAKKEWVDVESSARPDTLQFRLTRKNSDGTADSSFERYAVGSRENGYAVTWAELPRYDSATGNYYTYEVEEIIEGTSFAPVYLYNEEDGRKLVCTVTNVPASDVTAQKAWDIGEWPEDVASVEFSLIRKLNGGADETVETKTVTSEETSVSWTNLPRYEAVIRDYQQNGNAKQEIVSWKKTYSYRAEETAVVLTDGTRITGSQLTTLFAPAKNGSVITNRYPYTEVKAKKVWSDLRQTGAWPADFSVELTLKANGTAATAASTGRAGLKNPVRLTGAGEASWDHLRKYDDSGAEIVYTVEETGVYLQETEVSDLFVTSLSVSGQTTTVTNRIGTTELSIDKKWIDGTQERENWPEGYQVTYAVRQKTAGSAGAQETIENEAYRTGTIGAAQSGQAQERALPLAAFVMESGRFVLKQYSYDVIETGVQTPTGSLYAFDEESAEAVSLDASGKATLRNRYTTFEATKGWSGTTAKLLEGASVTFRLSRSIDGVTDPTFTGEAGTKVLTYEDRTDADPAAWTAAWDLLPESGSFLVNGKIYQGTYRYRAEEISFTYKGKTYTVTDGETDAPEWTISANDAGTVITNTLEDTTEFSFTKKWFGEDQTNPEKWPNKDDPDKTTRAIFVQLMRKGGTNTSYEVAYAFALNGSNTLLTEDDTADENAKKPSLTVREVTETVGGVTGYSYLVEIKDLPKYDPDGKEYTYSVREDPEQHSGNYQNPNYINQDGTSGGQSSSIGIWDGGIIENRQKIIALPATGGSGTLPFTLSGFVLLAVSALMYGYQKRRKYAAMSEAASGEGGGSQG